MYSNKYEASNDRNSFRPVVVAVPERSLSDRTGNLDLNVFRFRGRRRFLSRKEIARGFFCFNARAQPGFFYGL